MARTTFGDGTIVTTQFLNGAQKLHFDGLEEDWHYDPLDKEDMDVSDVGTGLGTKFVTLDTRQTLVEPKVFHNNPALDPSPLPDGTTSDQYRFTDKVIGQDPTAQKHLATKDYVDRAVQALQIPDVDYGSGNATVIINNQLSAMLDLSDLQPRFKGVPVAHRNWNYYYGTQHSYVNFNSGVIFPDGITSTANYMAARFQLVAPSKDNQVVGANFYLRTNYGVDIPLIGHRHWSGVYNNDNNHAYGNLVNLADNLIPLPYNGWSYIWGNFYFVNMRAFSYPVKFHLDCTFYDRKNAQTYYIMPDPTQNTKVVVVGPDKVKPVTFAGTGLGITHNVIDGLLTATATWQVDPSYIPGNPAYTGSTALDPADMTILYEFKSRIGDITDGGDPVNANKDPGGNYGSNEQPGTNTNATSQPLLSGEYMQIRVTATTPGMDNSSTTILNFQTDSPSITSVPTNFAGTALTDTSINITWDAVGGVKYRVDVEELGDATNTKSQAQYVWTDFATSNSLYSTNSPEFSGLSGNLTLTSINSGTTYKCLIRAIAPNALISPSFIEDAGTYAFEPGSVIYITTTGNLNDVAFSFGVISDTLANLTSLIPDPQIPAGSIGVIPDGTDRGIYIYDPNATPNVWVVLT